MHLFGCYSELIDHLGIVWERFDVQLETWKRLMIYKFVSHRRHSSSTFDDNRVVHPFSKCPPKPLEKHIQCPD